jgi:putative PIN family toxin of toxin-antitoxin system
MRFVLDTDVVVAAMRSPSGASAALLKALNARAITVLANVALFVEYEATCSRTEHLLASGLNMMDLRIFLDGLASQIEAVDVRYLWRPQLRDPADEMVLEAAINGQADAIVTFNVRDFGTVPATFGVQLLLPRDALRCIQSTADLSPLYSKKG